MTERQCVSVWERVILRERVDLLCVCVRERERKRGVYRVGVCQGERKIDREITKYREAGRYRRIERDRQTERE